MAHSSGAWSSRVRAILARRPISSASASALGLVWFDARWNRWRADRSSPDGVSTTHLSRIRETVRPGWRDIVGRDGAGFSYASCAGVNWMSPIVSSVLDPILPTRLAQWMGLMDPYWNESASYRVSEEGMWRIERASFELHSMILEAVEEVVQSDVLLESFGMPPELWPSIRRTWEMRESDLIGRFDLLWDGEGMPKLAEYNADTPTVLIESASAQRNWRDEKRPNNGQFNALEEALVDGWRRIIREESNPSISIAAQGVSFWDDTKTLGADSDEKRSKRWLAWAIDSLRSEEAFVEEAMTARFMYKMACKACLGHAGAQCKLVDFDELNPSDLQSSKSGPLWKLYPWEWLIYEHVGRGMREDTFSQSSFYSNDSSTSLRRRVLEPPWKLVASSKAMLAYLWRKYPNHPNLLPAAFADELFLVEGKDTDDSASMPARDWVAKPALGREGVGLRYGDEGDDAGIKKLDEFSREAYEAGNTLVLPMDAYCTPRPALSSSPGRVDLVSPTAAELFGQLLDELKKKFSVSDLLDRGVFSKKPPNVQEDLRMLVGPAVVQKYHDVASLNGRKVITSAWIVRGMPVAACFREDNARTTNNNSCFVPHWVESVEETQTPEANVYSRPFPLTHNQERIRRELYGEGVIDSSAIRGTILPDAVEHDIARSSNHSTSYYGRGGCSGCGHSPAGRDKPNKSFVDLAWFRGKAPGNGRQQRGTTTAVMNEAKRQEMLRRRARDVSDSLKSKLKNRNVNYAPRNAKTGAHGRSASIFGRGYSG